ncbi:hypothetical protein JVX91_05280 [Pseudomonas sp. PDNC002]|uniref:hypothetical protein n=1 Tax=Pseudomonas sp. PDNC002 TaxID=2811422 RepID=UPI0019623096|nr:hypothetical protein [Pseudomonas sp. PDNC002]QRY80520.1 hypothetical protein JVX91_05280 [Pseudomonas sp. PDNC002]
MSSQVHVARIDVWSRIFFAGALLLLLINQVQLASQVANASNNAPVAYVPSASSAPGLYREASRYPQPAQNQAQVLPAPQAQTQAQAQPVAPRQSGWVF